MSQLPADGIFWRNHLRAVCPSTAWGGELGGFGNFVQALCCSSPHCGLSVHKSCIEVVLSDLLQHHKKIFCIRVPRFHVDWMGKHCQSTYELSGTQPWSQEMPGHNTSSRLRPSPNQPSATIVEPSSLASQSRLDCNLCVCFN